MPAGCQMPTTFTQLPLAGCGASRTSTRRVRALSKAKVVIKNGGGYDDFVAKLLKSAGNSSARLLDAVEISGKTAPAGGELNEHVWYDLPTAGLLADRLAAALGQASPGDAATFTAHATAFKDRLKPLQDRLTALKTAHAGAPVAITEPVPGYLLEAAGLQNKTPEEFAEAIEEGDDVPPAALRETLALLSAKKVDALVYNAQTSGPQTQKVEQAAKDNGVPVVPVTETLPEGQDYLTWMAANITALQNALA